MRIHFIYSLNMQRLSKEDLAHSSMNNGNGAAENVGVMDYSKGWILSL